MDSDKIIRIAGMTLSIMFFLVVTPLMLFSLQGVGGPAWVAALHVVTVLATIASFLVVLTGFIMKYKLKVFIYFVISTLLLTIADLVVISGNAPQFHYSNIISVAIISVPSLIYVLGWHLNKSNAKKNANCLNPTRQTSKFSKPNYLENSNLGKPAFT